MNNVKSNVHVKLTLEELFKYVSVSNGGASVHAGPFCRMIFAKYKALHEKPKEQTSTKDLEIRIKELEQQLAKKTARKPTHKPKKPKSKDPASKVNEKVGEKVANVEVDEPMDAEAAERRKRRRSSKAAEEEKS